MLLRIRAQDDKTKRSKNLNTYLCKYFYNIKQGKIKRGKNGMA